jgi:hypothetical protein
MLKVHTRKQLQQLAKYATKSIHKWPSFKCGIGLADSIYYKPKEGPIFLKVILDKSDIRSIFLETTKKFNTMLVKIMSRKNCLLMFAKGWLPLNSYLNIGRLGAGMYQLIFLSFE